jgi:phospholipid/cholesterol/gamma-HCH transport system substrate-binding protein
MTARMRTAVALTAATGVLPATSGCSMTMRDLPIPGTGVSGDTIEVKADFKDALNLAQGAPVKVNGVDSGKVTSIDIDDYTAVVTMDVREDAKLHQGATARLRYTTPLGELFVDVTNPPKGTELEDGATLSLKETETAPTVEDALSEASLLINGGGLDQLQTITEELNTAMGGNEDDYRLLLNQATTFLTQANATTQSIDAVLTSLDSLSGTLGDRQDVINRAMKQIRPAAAVLRRATPDFTRLLDAVERFSSAANNTVNATRSQLLALLGETEPVLAELASNKGRFNQMLRNLATAADTLRGVVPGDYLSLSLDLHLDGIQAGNLGVLQNLLDLLDITAPIGDVLDTLGLGGLLGGLVDTGGTGRSTGTDSGGSGPVTLPGGTDHSDSTATHQLSLGGLLNGLLGGGS